MPSLTFSPYQELAEELLPHAVSGNNDGSHDISHIKRVWKNVLKIQAGEGGDGSILLAATILHDCVAVEKNSPLRAQASSLAVEHAAQILAQLEWSQISIEAVSHAILAHSYSANVVPLTLEAKILQDADRLDAIGLVGVVRCFYIAGRMGSQLYDADDPKAHQRVFDDKRFALDHFQTKLFKLTERFNTPTGAYIAKRRQAGLQRFFDEFLEEIL